jgi:hypothetical protein
MASMQSVTDASLEVPTFIQLDTKFRNKEISDSDKLAQAEKELKLAKNQLKQAKNPEAKKKLKFYVFLLENHVEHLTKDVEDAKKDTKCDYDEIVNDADPWA